MSTPPSPSSTSLATSIFSLPPNKPSSSSTAPAHALTSPSSANYRFSTLCASVDSKDQYGASSTPIYQTATFKGMDGQYDYTRSGNPTRGALESHLARLYGAHAAYALSTGMTCLDTILRLVKPGETVLAGDDLYGGTNRLLGYLGGHGGVDVRHVDTTRVEELEPHLGPGNKVRMVLLESPTNPLLKIADIAAISALVHAGAPDALVVVDNTMMSPYLQRPLDLGADIVYDSATKYLSGHHDLMAGMIAVSSPEIAKSIFFLINSVGSGLAPFDSFLLLRGVKTMSLRMDRQMATAQIVARYLHELGFLVHYPGLKSHPKHDIHWKQATGAGAVLSFVTGDKALSERIVGGTRLWGISVSFGAVNSLISMPCLMSHASISAAVRAARGLPENLIRLCVGIEDPRDLLDDLEHSLVSAGAIVLSGKRPQLLEGRRSEELFREDPEQWAVERARAFRRPGVEGAIDRLVDGIKVGLGFGAGSRPELKEEIVVSAPGKVILFGEHAVVYGITAIAASLDLRCYAVLSPRSDTTLALEVPNLSVDLEWPISALPWDLLPLNSDGTCRQADTELDPPLLEAIETLVREKEGEEVSQAAVGAGVAFVYLYMVIAGSESNAPSATLTASSSLPVGAGLGSSAAYSTCVASSLLIAHGHLSPASADRLSLKEKDLVDSWAFLAEKVLHGNPSGIDNAVSVRGGTVTFARAVGGKKGGLKPLEGTASMKLLLTNTLVPRDTKTLVAGVAKRRMERPEEVNGLLEAIDRISDEAQGLLSSGTENRQASIARLETLIRDNHAHLVSLGVSHPSLEIVKAATEAEPFGLATKLTGAGGGGCAVTLIPDAFPEQHLDQLLSTLRGKGFEAHLTTLGGPGFGILNGEAVDADATRTPDEGEGMTVPKRAALRDAAAEGLQAWAEGLGSWVYA